MLQNFIYVGSLFRVFLQDRLNKRNSLLRKVRRIFYFFRFNLLLEKFLRSRCLISSTFCCGGKMGIYPPTIRMLALQNTIYQQKCRTQLPTIFTELHNRMCHNKFFSFLSKKLPSQNHKAYKLHLKLLYFMAWCLGERFHYDEDAEEPLLSPTNFQIPTPQWVFCAFWDKSKAYLLP